MVTTLPAVAPGVSEDRYQSVMRRLRQRHFPFPRGDEPTPYRPWAFEAMAMWLTKQETEEAQAASTSQAA